ncbi:restriction endonuclease subunit S, partial [Actinophytocola sp.]|uniref:restriction endonuclease subunit S n=1 Tax=Actinophytocola sp. TaxID=1872138 RepID=UPI00389A6CF6
VDEELSGWGFQNSINRLRPIGGIDGRFIAFYLIALRSSGFIRAYSNVVSMPHLTAEKLARIPIPMPPLEEQRTIADYLDRETARIATLIEEQQHLIEMLRERRIAVIAHATSQGTDIEFRRVILALRQGWSPNCESWPADGVKEWGVLKVGCANTGRFDPAENKRLPDEETPRPEFAVRRGELVMSRSNTKDLVGAAAVVDGDYPRLLLSDLTYGILLTADADPAFVAYALASAGVRVQIRAASKGMSHSMQKISQRDIRELRLQLPALDEQRRIAVYLDGQTAKIDTLIAETKQFIELSKERRSALITAAVTGQIDVREMV